MSRHQPRAVLPNRHNRPGHRSDRSRQGRLHELPGPGAVLGVRPRHQSRFRRLGRHFRGRSPASASDLPQPSPLTNASGSY
ncbi:UNVERIFIED_CONTAM: hypothetical protein GTU68_062774 [Idotea baltica]|nr:hypothetical protein [Idotea baltica]